MIDNIILGIVIIVINLLPLILKKPKYILLTAVISVLLLLGFRLFR